MGEDGGGSRKIQEVNVARVVAQAKDWRSEATTVCTITNNLSLVTVS